MSQTHEDMVAGVDVYTTLYFHPGVSDDTIYSRPCAWDRVK